MSFVIIIALTFGKKLSLWIVSAKKGFVKNEVLRGLRSLTKKIRPLAGESVCCFKFNSRVGGLDNDYFISII